jgi:hypothetical protein
MNHARFVAMTILLLAGLLPGCGSPRGGQAGPSSPLAPTPTAPGTSQIQLNGYVGDTGLRRIGGATVEVLDGPQAGMVLTSDADGHIAATGGFNGVTMRATKNGYAPDTEAVHLTANGAWVYFNLVSLTPPVQMASTYTLTISADSSCAIPEEVRTRSYSATLTPTPNGSAPANTLLSGFVTGAQFAPYGNTFWIGVSGDYLGISTDGEGPSLIEDLGANRYLAYAIDATAAGVQSGAPTISVPFTGTIEYCERTSGVATYYDCSTYTRREQCTGTNGRLTLTAR